HSIRQTNTETSTKFMQRFLRLAGFLGAAAGIEEEQAKNFQWGLRRSTLNHLMCMSYTDVAEVANAARNYEILYERDDDDTERPDKRKGGSDNHRSNNNNYSGSNNRNSDTQESVVELLVLVSSVVKLAIYRRIARRTPLRITPGQADKKPGASGRVFAITEDHATKTSDVFPDELPGIPPVREVELISSLFRGQNPSPRLLAAWLR
nr:zinc finger, CCHC-type, retrotransposon Gag domain protein [Tanacetum cinerariifolium]